jgi:hypothetical protein
MSSNVGGFRTGPNHVVSRVRFPSMRHVRSPGRPATGRFLRSGRKAGEPALSTDAQAPRSRAPRVLRTLPGLRARRGPQTPRRPHRPPLGAVQGLGGVLSSVGISCLCQHRWGLRLTRDRPDLRMPPNATVFAERSRPRTRCSPMGSAARSHGVQARACGSRPAIGKLSNVFGFLLREQDADPEP